MDKNRLLSYIVKKGYNQRTLAKALGVSKNTLNSKINGKSYFDTRMISDMCELLDITDDSEKIKIFLAPASQNRDKKHIRTQVMLIKEVRKMTLNLKFRVLTDWNDTLKTILDLVEKIKERHPNDQLFIEVTFEN